MVLPATSTTTSPARIRGGGGGAILQQAVYISASGYIRRFSFSQAAIYRADHYAQYTALDDAVPQQVFHHFADDVGGHGKTVAGVGAGRAGNGGIDTDQPSLAG